MKEPARQAGAPPVARRGRALVAARAVGDLHALREQPESAPESTQKIMREMGGVTNEMIELVEIEARRRQAFDSAMMARRRELFERAYEGGAAGSAAAYLHMLQKPEEKGAADPTLIARLHADVRKAAAGGDQSSLLHMVMATEDRARELGVTPMQQVAYRQAWTAIEDERSPGWAATFEKFMPPAPTPSAAEQAEADALAQQVVEAWRRKRKAG